MTDEVDPKDEVKYFVYEPSVSERFARIVGWVVGWSCYWIARCGLLAIADKFLDTSIVLRRGNAGAVRTIGYLNGLSGKLALRRGRFLIDGQVGPNGPFAGKRFKTSYDVAARNEAQALELIRRFEWDAVHSSLTVESAEWCCDDSGAEGVLAAPENRIFYCED